MKNLANCKPTEFLKQTVRIKHAAEKWLDSTKILEIMKTVPELKIIDNSMTGEERDRVMSDNRIARKRQVKKNLSAAFDAVMEENPEETLVLLALVCFIEPKDVDEHSMEEYMVAISEMINNEAVVGFFTSLVRWGQMNI